MQDVLPFSSNEGEGCEESHQAHKRGVVTSPALLVHHADVLATFLVESPPVARNAAEDNDGKYLKKKKKSFFAENGGRNLQLFFYKEREGESPNSTFSYFFFFLVVVIAILEGKVFSLKLEHFRRAQDISF